MGYEQAGPSDRSIAGSCGEIIAMGIHLHRRAARLTGAALLVGALTLGSVSVVAAGNGNNGTVKIQEGATNAEPITRNEPHVCTFHMLFLFADARQEGDWTISQHAPTGSAEVLSGSYLTGADGSYATVEYGLPIGHYKLSWDGRNDHNQKHKTFWVTCENPAGPIGGGGGGGGGGEPDPGLG
jgi:hypothetical protein